MKEKTPVNGATRQEWREYKESAAYKIGKRDAIRALNQFSVWYVCAMAFYAGLQRKEIKGDFFVWSFCEGFNDAVDRKIKKLGMAPRKMYFPKTSDIGKG